MVVTTVLQYPNPAGPPPALSPTAGPEAPPAAGPLRTFGVEEELLLVDAETLDPLAVSRLVVRRHAERVRGRAPAPRHQVTTELQQEQLEVAGPPVTRLADQITAIRRGRALADAAAREVGARVVALASPVSTALPHLVPEPRYRRIQERFGLIAAEQLTCGFHVHVGVAGPDEGVAVLDRIRLWLPVVLGLSANSPFWYGRETGFSSFRYQAWLRWPTAGPTERFGSAEEYERRCAALLRSGVPLDRGMLYFDARLSARFPTVEVRIADVCLDAEHAGVLAALVRALVETAARQWRAGLPAAPVGAAQLSAWTWQASMAGPDGPLVSPASQAPAPAGEVVAELLEHVRPALAASGEQQHVESVVASVLRDGSGARRQREARAARGEPRDVVHAAVAATHR